MQDVVRDTYAFSKRLQARATHKVRAFQAAVRAVGYYVFQLSQSLVPVDTGALKASGWMRFGGAGTTFTFTIGYDAPYAIYVHEDLGAYHPQGQAKFLEAAARTARPHANTLIVTALRAA